MRVIFLDFDGVINDCHDRSVIVKAEFVAELKKVIVQTGAKIVVTSAHRDDVRFVTTLKHSGIQIYDYLPQLVVDKEEDKRELEIIYYLGQHSEIENFVIIEDDFVMKQLYDHQVFIEYSNGFTSEYVEPAIRILNGHLGFYPENYDRNETFEERMYRLFPSLFPEEEISKVLKKLV